MFRAILRRLKKNNTGIYGQMMIICNLCMKE